MRMTEFVQEKREVFLIQLIIDRKNKEIARLNNQAKSEENDLQDREMKIAETSNEYKMTSAQIEAALARARKSSEAATKKRVELQKELKCESQTVALIQSEILKNQDTLEAYRQYDEFLHSIIPNGKDFDSHFQSPETLLKYFDDIEQENLFLLDQFQNRTEEIEKDMTKYDKDMNQYDATYSVLKERVDSLPVVPEEQTELMEGNVHESEFIDNELQRLSNLIYSTFVKCFGTGSSLSAITMLEILEQGMEDLYDRIQYVKPSFRNEKMSIIDKQRHLQELRDEAERKEAQQQEKMLKAIERAKKPIPKKNGKPIRGRMLPNMFIKKDEEAERQRMLERKRIEDLLYGPDLE
ncbi:hypothetical protein TRFO_42172 [Tritrichomonas foetus]|uniref:DUF4200 domain-containing protein n=1 Tax=Tritrichomonas foetus TaxID=1144522 RepID=A0A1J4KXJ2_9EUKA|nr:hypothetical protein TRFO_42172 [Tritrichomonas foetus]|eukprot:OHT15969.1 hypothetical protein TRFO_42172 [Tritrichomonas foetus]